VWLLAKSKSAEKLLGTLEIVQNINQAYKGIVGNVLDQLNTREVQDQVI
jgi:RNase P/RNase MRP subunit p29